MTRLLAAVLLGMLVACNSPGPSFMGYPGLETKIRFYYNNRATEQNFSCNQPEMTISKAVILEDTPEQLVLDVTYYWRDNAFGRPGLQIGVGSCGGFAQRTFTVAKLTNGGVDVTAMSGPQRPQG